MRTFEVRYSFIGDIYSTLISIEAESAQDAADKARKEAAKQRTGDPYSSRYVHIIRVLRVEQDWH